MDDRKRPPQEVLAEAASRYGVLPKDLHLVRHVQNAVYSYQREGTGYILRVMHGLRKGCEEIAGELDWIRHLAGKGLPVCRCALSQRGRMIETLPAGEDVFVAVAFEKVPGQPIYKADVTPTLYAAFGQLIGRLHAATKDYCPSSPTMRRPEWHESHQINRDLDHLPAEQTEVRTRIRELVQRLKGLPRDRESFGLIHGDPSLANCFVDEGRLHLFDFDQCEYGYFASDIAAAVFETAIHVAGGGAAKAAKFWPTFWSGYRQENQLDPSWLEQLPDFIRLRDAWIYVHFHRIHNMPLLIEKEERIRQDFEVWRTRIEEGVGPIDVAFC
jgi:amicoumacin kinase